MDKEQAVELVRKYKNAISKDFKDAKVYLFGSYSKGVARPESDIDVAVVVSRLDGDWLEKTSLLWQYTLGVTTLIEPVLIAESTPSPLYEDILRTGIAI